ncbi:MAG TPA: hypothetical protein VK358_03605 [Longimicrobium sp.]|nr:hypothetical protein [Longimicrobium sp.]
MSLPFPLKLALPNPADDAAARAFPPTSRYHAIPTRSHHLGAAAAPVAYLARRFCPQGAGMPLLALAEVNPGERLDQLTARTLGDPTQFWRIADANHALDPADLAAAPGRVLRIPIPRNTAQP